MALFSKGDTLRSPEFHKKKQREKWLKISAAGIFGLLLVITPVVLFRMHRFQVTNIKIEGNSVTKSEEIEKIIADDLSGDYLWIFPRSNALFYPKKKILDDILNNIPRIETVTASLTGPTDLTVSVTERKPQGVYCADPIVDTAECYFIDNSGFIFSRAPSFTGEVYFIYSNDPPLEDPLGKTYLPEEEFQKIPSFIESLKTEGVAVRALVNSENEYHLILLNGGKIIFNKKDKLSDIASNLESFLNDQPNIKVAEFLDNISYIDMRF